MLEEAEFDPFFTELEGEQARGPQGRAVRLLRLGRRTVDARLVQRTNDANANIYTDEGLMINETPDEDGLAKCRSSAKASPLTKTIFRTGAPFARSVFIRLSAVFRGRPENTQRVFEYPMRRKASRAGRFEAAGASARSSGAVSMEAVGFHQNKLGHTRRDGRWLWIQISFLVPGKPQVYCPVCPT